MKSKINSILEWVDHHLVAPIANQASPPNNKGFISSFLFHRLFDGTAIPTLAYPHEQTTLAFFESFLMACKKRKLNFITPTDILKGNHIGKNNVMITFDDGYADNFKALPLLERHEVRATFFIAPAHILEQRRFWVDVLWSNGDYRWSRYMSMTHNELQSEIENLWPNSFSNISEFDRPLNLDEFLKIANSPLVEIGNHSFNHTVFFPDDEESTFNEINQANNFFLDYLGKKPLAVAYPNGKYDRKVIQMCRESGFLIGLTCEPRKEMVGSYDSNSNFMKLGRHSISGLRPINSQISSALNSFSIKNNIFSIKRQLNNFLK